MSLPTRRRLQRLFRKLLVRLREPRPHSRTGPDRFLAVPFGYGPGTARGGDRCAAILHIYFPEIAVIIRGYLAAVSGPLDLYISTDTEAKAECIRATFASWAQGTVEVRKAPNRGRDIAPKFIGMADVYDRYDLVVCLHSKKSAHQGDGGDEWRTALMQTLVGSPRTVASVLAMFEADPTLGLVFPQHYQGIGDWIIWGENRADAGRLAERLGFDLRSAAALDFVSGSMFWARTAALRPLLALELSIEDFPPEHGQLDGTLAHAIERLLLFVVERAGFSWLKIGDADLYRDVPGLCTVERKEDLAPAMDRARFRLLPPPG